MTSSKHPADFRNGPQCIACGIQRVVSIHPTPNDHYQWANFPLNVSYSTPPSGFSIMRLTRKTQGKTKTIENARIGNPFPSNQNAYPRFSIGGRGLQHCTRIMPSLHNTDLATLDCVMVHKG